jgi:glycosyltransferase involved in cell wall biosynthesis
MYRSHRIVVVVPAHNEERHIGEVLTSMPPFVDHVVVVDDGSTDRTAEVATAAADERTRLLRHPVNRGVGSALTTGYRAALDLEPDIVAAMGGDGQMDPARLVELLDPVIEGRCDFAKGNRFFRGGLSTMPRYRLLGNLVLTAVTRLATGYWRLSDAQNGYTAISGGTLERLPLHRMATGYQFENLLLIELSCLRSRIRDVPIPARYGEETSGMKVWRAGGQILWTLLLGFWRRLRTSRNRETSRIRSA